MFVDVENVRVSIKNELVSIETDICGFFRIAERSDRRLIKLAFCRTVERSWIHSVRSACGGRACNSRAERNDPEGLHRANHSQVREQPEQ